MIPAAAVIGIDVSRDWLGGFCAANGRRLRLHNTAAAHAELLTQLHDLSQPVRVGFEATGGQEWVLWSTLVAAGVEAVQLPPAQIKAFALSRGTRAKTDRIDAQLTAQLRERSLRSLYCCSDSVRGRGAAMTNFSHRASFHS